jgi:hypothetical protein
VKNESNTQVSLRVVCKWVSRALECLDVARQLPAVNTYQQQFANSDRW